MCHSNENKIIESKEEKNKEYCRYLRFMCESFEPSQHHKRYEIELKVITTRNKRQTNRKYT